MRQLLVALLLAAAVPAQNYQLVPNLVYDASLGLRLDLYLPLNATPPYPTVVWVFGGAWQAGSRSSAASPASQLCPRGYAVAGIDYRLSGVAKWPAQIHDCKGAVRWLRANAAQYALDPDRFGAWGPSAGGHLVACLATMHGAGLARAGNAVVDLEGVTGGNLAYSSRIQAVCDWYGPTEFVRMREFPTFDHDGPNSPESRLIGGPVQDNPDRAATANPIAFLTPAAAPLLIMHGTDDTTVPYAQSELLHQGAEYAVGSDVKFVPVPNTGHGGPGFQQLIGNVYAFFDARLRDLPATRVNIVASDPSAAETGDPGSFTVLRSGPVTEALLVRLWADGSAEHGTDCDVLPQLVQIPANRSSVTLPVTPRQDARVEGDETLVLRICAAPTYRVAAAQDAAAVTIVDDDLATGLPVITIVASDARATEPGADTGALVVSRSGGTSSPLVVECRVSGSALHGSDFAALPGTVTIPSQSATATIPIRVLDDGLIESGEFVTVMLRPAAGYVVGADASAGVVIADDDHVPAIPTVSVSLTDVTATEDGSDAGVFAVTRTGATSAPLTVPFTVAGNAAQGADYVLSHTSPVTIPQGAAWTRITVTGVQDQLVEGPESVALAVAPGSAWQLASQPAATLHLADDDASVPAAGLALAVGPLTRGTAFVATLAGGQSSSAYATWASALPAWIPLGNGVLQLDPRAGLQFALGTLDASGAAWNRVVLPSDPGFFGVMVHFQAAALRVSPPQLVFSNALVRRVD